MQNSKKLRRKGRKRNNKYMEEIWYTITGPIAVNTAHELITWVNAQIYNLPIKRLKLIISSNGGDIDSAIRIYVYLKSLRREFINSKRVVKKTCRYSFSRN